MRNNFTETMSLTILALSLFCSAVTAALTDIFTLTPGKTQGGCDAYAGVLSDYWDEAVKIIDAAQTAFDGFDDGPTEIPKIGSMFMGLSLFEMTNEFMLDPNSGTALQNIQGKSLLPKYKKKLVRV